MWWRPAWFSLKGKVDIRGQTRGAVLPHPALSTNTQPIHATQPRALQPQHQLDQFVLAQAFEIGASHDGRESASSVPRKGGAPAECSASCQPRRPTPWVITEDPEEEAQNGEA